MTEQHPGQPPRPLIDSSSFLAPGGAEYSGPVPVRPEAAAPAYPRVSYGAASQPRYGSAVPVQAPGYGYQPPAVPGFGESPKDVAHWLIPVGRSWQSITAGYLGIFGLLIWPLAPFAVWLGVWALVNASRTGGHGRGRAIFAIVSGSGVSLVALFAIASALLSG
jgi:hypothetical protein